MNYKLLTNYLLHVTHNDADAVGCALVVDWYAQQYRFADSPLDMKDYNVNHRFLSVKYANYMLNVLTDTLLKLKYHIKYDTSFDVNDSTLSEFKEFTWGTDYNDSINTIFIPDTIFITDLSIEPGILDKLEDISKYYNIHVKYVDHHKSSMKNNKKYDWCYVKTCDENFKPRAACKLFMDLFIKDKSESKALTNLIEDISRYDTWLWKNEPRENMNEDYTKIIIDTYGNVDDAYESIDGLLGEIENDLSDVPEFKAMIMVDKWRRESYVYKYLHNTVYCMGYELGFNDPLYATSYFALVILPENYGNDIMEEIYTKSKRDIDVVIGLYPNSKMLSFRRGPKSKIDLSVLASKYGGGGHAAAAGATCDTNTFMKFLELYYNLLDNKKV